MLRRGTVLAAVLRSDARTASVLERSDEKHVFLVGANSKQPTAESLLFRRPCRPQVSLCIVTRRCVPNRFSYTRHAYCLHSC